MKLTPGDLIFMMNHGNWVSRQIAWFMGSRWSHVAIAIESTENFTYILETSDFEVVVHTLDDYWDNPKFDFEIWRPIYLSEESRKMVVKECLNNLGVNYGYLQLLSFGVRRLLMRLGIRIPNFIHQGIVCNELTLSGYIKSEIPCFSGLDVKSIDCEEFYQKVINAEYRGSPVFEKVVEKLCSLNG